ncbi:MAG: single-stranded DNA-binding protein [Acidimicrobiales bacterium]
MSNGNNVTLVGNVTRDPELRFTNSGQAVASFGLAVNRRWQNRQTSEWEESTSFFNVVAWGSLGENASESLTKGARVLVTGRLEQRSYETQDGEKRSVTEVVADELGPSLRWATAQVQKTERRAGDGGPGGPGPSGGGGGGPRPAAVAAPAGGAEFDEEPF